MNARRKKSAWLIIGILAVATTLRAPFTSLAPLLGMIQDDFQLTASQAGILQTLPLLAFAIFSPFAAGIARKWGMERVIFAALMVVGAGILIRSFCGLTGLYLGTLLVGMGIALGNVLLPGILKRDLPHRAASLTGFYALTMGLSAALGSATVVPIAHTSSLGWELASALTLLYPLVAGLVWLPQISRLSVIDSAMKNGSAQVRSGGLWGSVLAWQVSLFFGLNSLVYYIIVAWLPAILQNAGFSTAEAGSLHGLLQLATAVPGFFIGFLLSRMRDQRLITVVLSLLGFIGLVGLIVSPGLAMLWVILLGISTGAGIILGLTFISLRSGNPAQAASLSGMAQCIGYLLAAGGPPVAGMLHDFYGSWRPALMGCAILVLILTVFGYLAGRARQITPAS